MAAKAGNTASVCVSDPNTEIYDCGKWAVSATWAVPSDAISGVYVALLSPSSGGASEIPFVVRNDASTSKVLFKTSDATWQAYNTYGGADFYQGNTHSRARRISYNRPFWTRGTVQGRDYLFSNEYPMLKFLERNGYDLSYTTDVDTDRSGALIKNHQVFMSTGHDEYWSKNERNNVDRRAGRRRRTSPSSAATRSTGRPATSRASMAATPPTARSPAGRRRGTTPSRTRPPVTGPAPGVTRGSARRPTAASRRTR